MPRPRMHGRLIRQIDMRYPQTGGLYRISVTEESVGQCHVYYEFGPSAGLIHGFTKASQVSQAEAMEVASYLLRAKETQKQRYEVVSDRSFEEASSPPPPQQKASPPPHHAEKLEAEPGTPPLPSQGLPRKPIMESTSSNISAHNNATVIKGIALTPPVIGRITAGHTVMRGGLALPVPDDHYSITTLVQNRETRLFEEHPLQKQILGAFDETETAQDKLRAIPVRIAYNNNALNLNNNYSAFEARTGRALCVGNGVTARRVTEDGVKEMVCPRPEGCVYAKANRCRNFTRAYFRIEGQEDELGTFILRSTSYNTVDRLGSRLSQLAGLTGGQIAGMPMMLVLCAKTTTQSMREPIYFSDLVTRPGMTLLQAVAEARRYQETLATAGLSLEGLEQALATGLANSDFADELEDEAEWLSDDGLIAAASAQGPADKRDLHGLTSLSARLNAMAKGAENASSDLPPESGPGAEEVASAQQEQLALPA